MGGIIKGLFGIGDTPQAPSVNLVAPQAPAAPTPVAPPPSRSDADIQSEAAMQRRKYASGSSTRTNLTGGLGVPSGSTYSASANLLGA